MANRGVRGVVRFENGSLAENVSVKIDSREPFIKTNKNGEYNRILLSDTYKLRIAFECLNMYETRFDILNSSSLAILNITLNESLTRRYNEYSGLNKYPVFCSTINNNNINFTLKVNCSIVVILLIGNLVECF